MPARHRIRYMNGKQSLINKNMKTKKILLFTIVLVFISVFTTNQVIAQNCVCALCNVPCSAPASAHTNTNCNVYKNRLTGQSSTSGRGSMEQAIMGAIFSNMLTGFLKNNSSNQISEQEKARLEQEKQIQQQRMAEMLKRQKAYNDSVAQARHDKMMKDYKKLEGSGELSYKGLDYKVNNPPVHFNCKITSFKGTVSVVKSDGRMVKLTPDQSIDLAPGDWLATGPDSKVKLHYDLESDGEDILLGQKSAINIVKDERGVNVPKLMRGQLYVTNNLVEEKVAEYKEEFITQSDKAKNELMKELRKKFQPEIRTGTAVLAIRGTEFTINVDTIGNTEVLVFKGEVDLTGLLIENKISLTEGYKGIVKRNGEIIGPTVFEKNELEFWWTY